MRTICIKLDGKNKSYTLKSNSSLLGVKVCFLHLFTFLSPFPCFTGVYLLCVDTLPIPLGDQPNWHFITIFSIQTLTLTTPLPWPYPFHSRR